MKGSIFHLHEAEDEKISSIRLEEGTFSDNERSEHGNTEEFSRRKESRFSNNQSRN